MSGIPAGATVLYAAVELLGLLLAVYLVVSHARRGLTSRSTGPSPAGVGAIAAAGYNVVLNLALHNDPRYSLRDEAASVRALGLDYVHIPVQFGAPTEGDLVAFFDAMDRNSGRRVWIHCAANMRVTAFVGLYRVLRLRWAEEDAFSLMHTVWKPDQVWSAFIASQLAKAHDG